eukprot:1159931-Pelagomonas_calceolata.AAC.15
MQRLVLANGVCVLFGCAAYDLTVKLLFSQGPHSQRTAATKTHFACSWEEASGAQDCQGHQHTLFSGPARKAPSFGRNLSLATLDPIQVWPAVTCSLLTSPEIFA